MYTATNRFGHKIAVTATLQTVGGIYDSGRKIER